MAKTLLEIQAKDNASKVLKDTKQAVQDLGKSVVDAGKSSNELDKIKQRFDKISESTMPAKRQMRELQQLMANMNLKGLSNTEVFTEIAQKAGSLKDAMQDASQAVSAYANDTFALKAAGEAFTGIAAAGSIATGVMGMFGTENEKVQKILLKVQSAQAILNGVTAIANVLNKDSALSLKLKQIWMKANAASTTTATVATNANTAATAANTIAVNTSTAAQKSWNMVKAIGKALVGDFTGLLILGAAGLATYAMATSDSAEETEQHSKAVENAKDLQESYNSTMASSFAQLMGSYAKLRAEWNKLSSDHERNQWIKDNKSELEKLGGEIDNAKQAEDFLNNNTAAVVESFRQKAKAAAYFQAMVNAYQKQIEIEQQAEDALVKFGKKAGDKYNGSFTVDYSSIKGNYQEANGGKYASNDRGATWYYTAKGAAEYNTQLFKTNATLKDLSDSYDDVNKKIKSYEETYGELASTATKTNKAIIKANTHHNKKDGRPKPKSGSLDALNAEKSLLEQNLRAGLIPDDKIQAAKETLERLKKSIEEKEIALGLRVKEVKVDKLPEQLKALEDKFNSLEFTPKVSSFDKAIGNNKKPMDLNGIESQMDMNDKLIEKLQELKKSYEELGQTGTDAYDRVTGKVKELTDANIELGNQAQAANEKQIDAEKHIAAMEDMEDAIYSLSSGMSSLGQIFKATGDDSAAMAMTIIQSVTQMVAQLIPQIMTLIAAQEGEALASGTASAAKVPYPANIAAIASIVATLLGTFGTIAAAVAGSYADGGIIQGKTTMGDHLLARVNAGEMILNNRQQKHLFSMLDNGNNLSQVQIVGDVKLRGSDLYLSMKNLGKVKGSIGKNIGIH